MIIKQFYLGCLAHASYLVVDERTRRAAVIDPQRDIDQYLELAEELGATIEFAILTHFHADFVAGHLELRERVGATIALGARASAEYEFRPLGEGDSIRLGDVELGVLETPGHTPEAISIVATDRSGGATPPEAVFTGDTLFIGDVGRPDLLASEGVTAEELAGWLYESLHNKLMPLPDATLVYPAHGAGSLCGKNMSKETFSTMGVQRANNYALQPMTKDAFREIVTASQPQVPGYFVHDVVLNKKERPTLEASLQRVLQPLSLDAVLTEQREGAVLVDVRDAESFASGHLAGSLNIGLEGKFATWSGTLVPVDARIVIVADPGRETEAAMRLGRIGLDGVAGYLDGGPGSFGVEATLARTTVHALNEARGAAAPPFIVDVRNPGEWEAGHIEGSLNVPVGQLQARLGEIPRDRPLAVVCLSGYRSSAACSVMAAAGFDDLRNVVGGMEAWTAAALPTALTAGTGSCGA